MFTDQRQGWGYKVLYIPFEKFWFIGKNMGNLTFIFSIFSYQKCIYLFTCLI